MELVCGKDVHLGFYLTANKVNAGKTDLTS